MLKTPTILKFHYLVVLQYKLRETRNTEPKANSITAIHIAKKLKSNYVGDSPTSNDTSYCQNLRHVRKKCETNKLMSKVEFRYLN